MAMRTLFESVEGRSVGIPHERSLSQRYHTRAATCAGCHGTGSRPVARVWAATERDLDLWQGCWLPRNGISTCGGSLPCHRSESWSRTVARTTQTSATAPRLSSPQISPDDSVAPTNPRCAKRERRSPGGRSSRRPSPVCSGQARVWPHAKLGRKGDVRFVI